MASISAPSFPLPNEILSLVADLLHFSDVYDCQRVCRTWRAVFRHALYRSVDTDLDSWTLAHTDIPFQYIRHLKWHPLNSCYGEEEKRGGSGVVSLLNKVRLLQSLDVPYPTVFRHLDPRSQSFLHLRQLTLDTIPTFSVVGPLLSSLPKLRCLALSCLSPQGGNLMITDLDAIVRHVPELIDLSLRSRVLLCPSSATPLPSNVHRKLTSLQISFQCPAKSHAGEGVTSAPWLFYLSQTFPALQHLTLAGGSGSSSSSSRGYVRSEGNPNGTLTTDDDVLFMACNALSRLPALTSVRLIHVNNFIHPNLYPLLVRHKQQVELIGDCANKGDAWLVRILSNLQDHTTHLNMTVVYPRALCSSPLLERLPLTSLSIGGTAGFCSSRDHWQVPMDDLLVHTPHLIHLAFYQVTLSYHADPVTHTPLIPHGLTHLRLQDVVLSSTLLEQCGRRCPRLHTLVMTRCKWMDPMQQAGYITFSPDHRFQVMDIRDSGHLYSLHVYQLLTLHGQWILAPRPYPNRSATMGISKQQQQQQCTSPGSFSRVPGYQQEVQAWKEFRTRQKEPQCRRIDPDAWALINTAYHDYLTIQCKSVDQLYFNGSRRISLLPPRMSA